MATAFLSDQETARTASPVRRQTALDIGGRVTRLLFAATLPAAGLMIGDTIQLVCIPAYVVVCGGAFCWSEGQGQAQTAIGVEAEPTRYGPFRMTPSQAVVRFAERQPQAFLRVLTTPELLVAVNGRAPWLANSVLKGFIEFCAA